MLLVSKSVCPGTVACLPTVGCNVVIQAMPILRRAICHVFCLLFLLVYTKEKVIMATPCDDMHYAVMLTVAYKLSLHYILR